MDSPGIAVIIAARNAAATVARSITSALRQPETAEIVLVDDGSTDATADVARTAGQGDPRLRVVTLERNLGPSAARNLALELTAAPLATILDADDWLQPGRFARLLASAGQDWDLLADDLLVAEEGELVPSGPLLGIERPHPSIGLEEFVRANLPARRRKRRELGYLKPLMRRDFLAARGLRYDPAVRLGEDYLLYAGALARGGRFQLMPACGYVAVQTPGSLSRRHGAAELLALARGDENLLALADLPAGARAALRAHRRSTLDKHFHRLALDAKAAGRWGEVAQALVGTRSAAAHIVAETIRARLGRWRWGGPARPNGA